MKHISVLIILLFISSSLTATEICGKVIDKVRGGPIYGVNVYFEGTKIGMATNENGEFRLQNNIAGKYILHVCAIGYFCVRDTIEIDGLDNHIDKDYILDSPVIKNEDDPKSKKYHDFIKQYPKEKILTIVIDSVKFIGRDLSIFSTFNNKIDTPLYVIRHVECLFMINPIIRNSKGKMIKNNEILCDCNSMKIHPDSMDFIKIKPHEKIQYPIITLDLYNFSLLPEDTYSIQIKYTNKKRDYIGGFFNKDLIENKKVSESFERIKTYYNYALRGEWVSDNIIYFNNYELVKK